MNKIITSVLLLSMGLWSIDVPIEEVEKRSFFENISVNSKIVQLSSSKSLVMASKGGKIIKYLCKEGDKVKKGQALAEVLIVAPVELSMNISPLKAELKTLKRRFEIAEKNYNMVHKLYTSGLESAQNLNKQEEEKLSLASEIEIIKAKIATLQRGKNSSKNRYTLHAGTSGRVEKILVAPNAVVDSSTALISIVKGEESFLVKSYVPLKYMSELKLGQKGEMLYGGKSHKMRITQIVPTLDEKTQQIEVISTLDESVKNLFVNAYVTSKLHVGEQKSYLSVKKSALSFFKNEWVVFVPEHHEEEGHDEHDEHGDHGDHGDHEHEAKSHEEEHHEKEGHEEEHHENEEHKKEEHDAHGHGHGHGEHEEEEVPFSFKIVKVLKQNEQYVAIEGLKEHEDYVSDKAYHVKSLILKSSLGGHGH